MATITSAAFFGKTPSNVMRDTRLSLELRGLLAIVSTYPQDGSWKWHQPELQRLCNVGREKYFGLIREAKRFGFLRTVREQYIWNLSPEPVRETSTSSEPVRETSTGPVRESSTELVRESSTLSKISFSKNSLSKNQSQNLSRNKERFEGIQDHHQPVNGKADSPSKKKQLQDPDQNLTPKERKVSAEKRESPPVALPPGTIVMNGEIFPPPDPARFRECKNWIMATWDATFRRCRWGKLEDKWLTELLQGDAAITVAQLAVCFGNFQASEDHEQYEPPSFFLKNAYNYSVCPINKYGRSYDAVGAEPQPWAGDLPLPETYDPFAVPFEELTGG